MKMLAATAPAILLGFGILHAHAGDVRDFEDRMRSAYGDYRMALFATNSGKAAPSAEAVNAFEAAWAPLAQRTAPPQYADDPAFAATMAEVAALAAAADREIAAGDLPKAHETLEGIRDAIGDLHARNGIIGFSDRMNAYHARMEHVIGMDPSDPAAVLGEAAVLAYLLADITSHPPAEASDAFHELAEAVRSSVETLSTDAATGDAAAIKAAIGGLKAPYSKLFLKFG